jgi:ABC-2 type transport system permease protein
MWQQILAIAWAQFRITRNRFPRTSFGAVLHRCLSLLWYGMFAGLAVFLAISLPQTPLAALRQWLPVGLLGVFLYWQTVPLLTLSGGWSLQLNRLQIYPVSNSALFTIEVVLRITSSPEIIVLLLGALVGLARHAAIPTLAPLCLLLFLPCNLLMQLAIRDFIAYAFDRSRFRELFTILVVSIGVLPQLVIRTGLAHRLRPYFFATAHSAATPWQEVASLSLGSFSFDYWLAILFWTAFSFIWARRQFQRGLVKDDTFRGATSFATTAPSGERAGGWLSLSNLLGRLFRDPMGALLQKEFQSLVRMPRFRVVFAMACIFGVIVFVPVALGRNPNSFLGDNFLPVVNLYGLLLLSDALLLNVFGLDRTAAQLFFVAPVPLRTVLKAKNVAALFFVALQTVAVLLVVLVMRIRLGFFGIASGMATSIVVAVFLLSAGNLLSVSMPRPIDPSSTFRKQAGGRMQLWVLLCSLGMLVLVAFPFLARWAFQKDWTFFAILLLEFVIGLIVYRIAMDSAVEHGLRNRERIVDALSKGASPVSSALG